MNLRTRCNRCGDTARRTRFPDERAAAVPRMARLRTGSCERDSSNCHCPRRLQNQSEGRPLLSPRRMVAKMPRRQQVKKSRDTSCQSLRTEKHDGFHCEGPDLRLNPQTERLAQVNALDFGIAFQGFGAAGADNAAVIDDVGA